MCITLEDYMYGASFKQTTYTRVMQSPFTHEQLQTIYNENIIKDFFKLDGQRIGRISLQCPTKSLPTGEVLKTKTEQLFELSMD